MVSSLVEIVSLSRLNWHTHDVKPAVTSYTILPICTACQVTHNSLHFTDHWRQSAVPHHRATGENVNPLTNQLNSDRMIGQIYTVIQKNCANLTMAITLSINRFEKFLHCCKQRQISRKKSILVYPPHFKYVAALPWEA